MKSERENDSLTALPRKWLLVHIQGVNMPHAHALLSKELTNKWNDRGNIKGEHVKPKQAFYLYFLRIIRSIINRYL